MRKKKLLQELERIKAIAGQVNEANAMYSTENWSLKQLNSKLVQSNRELTGRLEAAQVELESITGLNKLLVASNGDLTFQVERLLELNKVRGDELLELSNALRAQRGADRPNRKKLTKQEVKDIRAAYKGGMKQKDLADNYGVNPATISRLVRGIYH